jgi:uncharacterized membrane protein YkoI
MPTIGAIRIRITTGLVATAICGSAGLAFAAAALAHEADSGHPDIVTGKRQLSSPDDSSGHTPALTPGAAAGQALHQGDGRLLNVKLEHGSTGPYYRVKFLHKGRVHVVHIDAQP